MTNFGNLPFEKLIAYQEALNISEGAGRSGSADKARVYAIARGEDCEAAAALDIALAAGTCKQEAARRALLHARAVHALLSGLIRRFGICG